MAFPISLGDYSTPTFIDLFAGIGGFHLAFHDLGAKCVFAAEKDRFARQTYRENFLRIAPDLFALDRYASDITTVDPSEIPDFDILTAGFPCQPFSNAGHKRGFEDTRGTLFFNVADILRVKRPRAFLLENVSGLVGHDGGNTFRVIQAVLEGLGYSVHHKIVKASEFGLPQHRKRLFILGFRNRALQFDFPKPVSLQLTMSDVLGGRCDRKVGFTLRVGGRGSGIHDRRNWDTYVVDGREVRLTVNQAKRMQGFPASFTFPVSDTQAMKQLGNSVAVTATRAIAAQILEALAQEDAREFVLAGRGVPTNPMLAA